MPTDLVPEELIRTLRALAQDSATQRALFPAFVAVPDELVEDFGAALDQGWPGFLTNNPDIAALDDLIRARSGLPEFWTDEALDHAPFWSDLRNRARQILSDRGLPLTPPLPAPHKTYISGP